jgi:hypothetical protein
MVGLTAQRHGHGPALEACASRRRSKMRPSTVKTSRADFRSWGLSWTGSIPRSTRALEIPTTSCDSCSASAACSPLISSTCARSLLVPPTCSNRRGDASHAHDPPPISPLAPPGPSPTGKGGSDIPPTSG